MIIKVHSPESGYVVFGEIDYYSYRYIANEEADMQHHIIDLRLKPNTTQSEGSPVELNIGDPIEIRLMTRHETQEFTVYANSPVYVMNDDGKTIDTI
ncbi:MAG: hypothetical protein ACYST3_07255 [Planctomycetota bacterium]|jgi:hypothetical protein